MFRRWSASRRWAEAFGTLSAAYQDVLKIRDDVQPRDFRSLMPHDHFEEIDRRIIVAIVEGLAKQSLAAGDVLKWVRERRQSHWYGVYADVYQAIGYATEFQQALAEADLTMTSVSDGVKRYAASWFRLDQLYRKFIYHMQQSGQARLLSALYEAVENRYTTNFVLKLNDAWQDHVTKLTDWAVPGFPRQMDFYKDQAAEFRRKDQKVVVIISDALRYEVAEEALREIRKLNRFGAELKLMIAALPSCTLRQGPGEVGDVPRAKFITRDIDDGKLLADFTPHLGFGATDIAACGFQIAVDDITNRAGLPSCSIEAKRGFKLFVAALQPCLRCGQTIKARRLLMDDPALGLYKDLCAIADRAILAFTFDD